MRIPEVIRVPLSSGDHIELECSEGVHVPGPFSLELAKMILGLPAKSLLDLGCGCGLLGIAAAKAPVPAREVWATDIDPRAVACAKGNAERNGVAVHVEQGDLFEPVLGRRFDLIVTNPPQTPAPERARGEKFGGEDGL